MRPRPIRRKASAAGFYIFAYPRLEGNRNSMMQAVALGAIRLYQQALSPYISVGLCRHEPTCSRYTYEAIQKYGVVKGVWTGVKRLARCRPGGSSGYDPVP